MNLVVNRLAKKLDRAGAGRCAFSVLVACVALGLSGWSGCAADLDPDGTNPDAGPPGTCASELTRLTSQASLVAPATVEYSADTSRTGTLIGAERFTWRVVFIDTGESVTVTPKGQSAGAERVEFPAEDPGPYQIAVASTVASQPCQEDSQIINVRAANANQASYWLRLLPPPRQPAIGHDALIQTLYGGANYHHGDIALRSGAAITGEVLDASGSPVPAFVRLAPRSRSPVVELNTDSSGKLSARVEAQVFHDVLVVPRDDPTVPVMHLGDVSLVPSPGENRFALAAGIAISGTVIDESQGALAGARVALTAGSIPATVATTGASGQFSAALAADAGTAVEVAVTPPSGSGLPSLTVPAGAGLTLPAAGGSLQISYASDLVPKNLAPTVVTSASAAPIPGARVTWVSRAIAGAGKVTPGGGAEIDASGTVRAVAIADGAGKLPALDLPEAIYDVVIEPGLVAGPDPDRAVTIAVVDLTTGPVPTQLTAARPARVTGKVVDARASAVAGARVVARPLGLLAQTTEAATETTTATDGAFEVFLAPGGDYEITAIGQGTHRGRERISVPALAAGSQTALNPIALPDTLRLSGRLVVDDDGLSGVTVHLLCNSCAGLDPDRPLGEALSDRDGKFTLHVPDPGVAAQ